MQTILLAGAGKSSSYLVHYLLSNATRNKWKIIIADASIGHLSVKLGNQSALELVAVDIQDSATRQELIHRADLVISLMPPSLHILIARDCLTLKKHLITSSYISPEMRALHDDAKAAGLMFMCEMGLDPGIDHMSATKVIHSIQRVAGTLTSFRSYCGGLISPESDDNPWHYKFTWNPMNVVLAGSDGARYLSAGKTVEVPYEKIFENNKKVKVENVGTFAWYPNRDSFRYLDLYDVPDIKNFLRATLRFPAFTRGWQALVSLGLTNNVRKLSTHGMTSAGWLRQLAVCPSNFNLYKHIARTLDVAEDDKQMHMLQWLGLFEETPLPEGEFTCAEILLPLLQSKWELQPGDRDMVVMQHEFEYVHKGVKLKLNSAMTVMGDGKEFSAMSKTVGLPIGILARQVLTGKLTPPAGVHIPNMPAVYRPVLTELAHFDIQFQDFLVS